MNNFYNLWLFGVFLSLSKAAYCVLNKSCAEAQKVFTPNQDYFLPYMVQLKHNYSMDLLNASSCSSNYVEECKLQPHSFSYFNKMVYSVLCAEIKKPSDNYCSKFVGNFDRCINGKQDCPLLCTVIFMYLHFQDPFDVNDTFNSFLYKEVIIEDVPFCYSITCPSLESKLLGNKSILLSAYDAMPRSCQIGFFIILFLDIILSFLIAVANGAVILVGTKYTFIRFSGG